MDVLRSESGDLKGARPHQNAGHLLTSIENYSNLKDPLTIYRSAQYYYRMAVPLSGASLIRPATLPQSRQLASA